MAYVTEKDYEDYGFGQAPSGFDEYAKLAGDVIDHFTRYYYLEHDLEAEKSIFRQTLFKKAVCAQIKYYDDLGSSSYAEMNATPNQITIGRTSITNSGQRGQVHQPEVKAASPDAMRYLSQTGLLYRGVGGYHL